MTESMKMAESIENRPRGTAVVVDDGYVERMLGKAMLEKIGYEVSTAENGEQALRLVDQLQADLVVCDIQMPGMSGLEVLERIENIPDRGLRPAVILCTGHIDLQLAPGDRHPGLAACLSKPLSLKSLRQALIECDRIHPPGAPGSGLH
jgi:CheY-like chemotaxis protein